MYPEFCACQLENASHQKLTPISRGQIGLGLLYERNVAPLGRGKVAASDLDPTLLAADDRSNQIERPIEACLHRGKVAYRWHLSGTRPGRPLTHPVHGYLDLRYAVDRVFLAVR